MKHQTNQSNPITGQYSLINVPPNTQPDSPKQLILESTQNVHSYQNKGKAKQTPTNQSQYPAFTKSNTHWSYGTANGKIKRTVNHFGTSLSVNNSRQRATAATAAAALVVETRIGLNLLGTNLGDRVPLRFGGWVWFRGGHCPEAATRRGGASGVITCSWARGDVIQTMADPI